MTRFLTTLAATACLLGGVRADDRGAYKPMSPAPPPAAPQRPTFLQVLAEEQAATRPAPMPMPADPKWATPGDAEALTKTGRPAEKPAGGDGAAGGEGGHPDNGTNPAQNSRTVILANELYRLDGGNFINTTYLRLKFPVLERRGGFLVEMPFNYYDPTAPVAGQVGGLGDLKFQFNYNAFVSADKSFTFLWMSELFIPSADTVLLDLVPNANAFVAQSIGTGKFVWGQGAGMVFALAPNFIMAPLYFYEESFAGVDARPNIRRGKFRFFLMYAWESGLYVLPEFQVATNLRNGNNDAYAAPEVGYSTKGTTFYVKPGLGLRPDVGDREWGVEAGLRVQF